MNKNTLISSLLMLSALCTSATVYAQNNGHFDDKWLSVRIKSKLQKAIDWTGWPAGPFDLVKNIPIDTGKDRCYMHLTWDGPDSFSYTWETFCLNGNDLWEKDDSGTLYEFKNSESIGVDWVTIELALAGRVSNGYPPGYAFAEFDGALILTPKINKAGNVTSVTRSPSQGAIYYYDDQTEIGGTTHIGDIAVKLANTVPEALKTCAAGGDAPLCP